MSRSARHAVILVTVALCGCLAAFGGWRFAKASAPVNGPIILISIDALRADHLPAYGYAAGRTPAIDALASDSVLFEHAYAHVPQTLPAHASLLTGRLPFETGVRDVAGFALDGSSRTVAEILRDRGYKTAGIVSSFLLRRDTGIGRGFALFDDELPAPSERPDARALMRDGLESEHIAENWLDSVGTSRAFLFLHLAEPHAPYAAPSRFEGLSPYDAEIAYADEIVGRLLRYLKAHQLYDRSTILLVSDHGEGLGEHGEQGHGLLAYEEALRIPLIIKQPGGEGARRRVSSRVQQVDVVPTILDLAKAPGAGGLRGRSLTPLMGGSTSGNEAIYAESRFGAYRFGWRPLTSLIVGRYQLLEDGNTAQLLDLEESPESRLDRSSEHPDIAESMRNQLSAYATPVSELWPSPVTETDRARYEALGYVGVPGTGDATPPSGDVESTDTASHVEFIERYRSAVLLAQSNDWKGALDEYRTLTREEAEMPDLWLHLARLAASNERHDIAVDAFRRVLALAPEGPAGHLGAAASLLRVRKLDEAALQSQAVLETPAADAVLKSEAHELLARVALARKDAELARTEAAAAEAEDPNRPVVAFVEGRVSLDRAAYAEAAEHFDAALAAAAKTGRPPLADLRVYAAEALSRVEREQDAERLLNAELTAFPANPRARAALRALYRASGRSSEAAAIAQR